MPELPASNLLAVLHICTAYESGFGHGLHYYTRALPNPYTLGTDESQAYQIGYDAGCARRTQPGETPDESRLCGNCGHSFGQHSKGPVRALYCRHCPCPQWQPEQVKISAAETAGYAKCVHSMADAIGVAEEQWSIDGFCAACAWHASRVKTSDEVTP